MKLDCPHKATCSYLEQGLDWCNLLPVWYQNGSGTVVGCTLGSVNKKNKANEPIYRYERAFPSRPCKCTRRLVTERLNEEN